MYNFTKLKHKTQCIKLIKKEEKERINCANKPKVHY